MPMAALAKGSFVATIALLVVIGRTPWQPAVLVVPDLIFAALFLYAFAITGPLAAQGSESRAG